MGKADNAPEEDGMSHREMDALVRKLEAQGFVCERLKNNHWRVKDAGGRFVTVMPSSPSDHRSIKNCLAVLRRAGFDPAPARKKKTEEEDNA